MVIFGAICAVVVLFAYVIIAAQLVLVLVESYIVLSGGVMFLRFATFRGTGARRGLSDVRALCGRQDLPAAPGHGRRRGAIGNVGGGAPDDARYLDRGAME